MRFLRGISLAFLAISFAVSSHGQSKSLTAEQQQVVDAVKSIFDAATADDVTKFNSIVMPGYYMFDGGERFDGDSIMKLIGEDHAKGVRYEWSVTEPDVHVGGTTAWVAYLNRGSITDAQGKTAQMTWLESAFLEKHDGAWKIAFVHSTRVRAPQNGK